MKIAAIFALLLCQLAHAQTNFFPVLHCKERNYTNVTIKGVTPTTVLLDWDGGGERISITNLPPELQNRYHYDPIEAKKHLDAQAAKKAAQQESANREAVASRLRAQEAETRQARIAKNSGEVLATDADATNELVRNGYIELTAKSIEIYPEKADLKLGWMDVKFCDVHPPGYVNHDDEVWFTVEDDDKNRQMGDFFDNCIAYKNSTDWACLEKTDSKNESFS
jgi:hypothetical protein